MDSKDIKQIQDENIILREKNRRLLEEIERLREYQKKNLLPSSIFMKRLLDSDIKKDLFDGIDIDGVVGMAEGDRRQFMLYNAERIIGLKPKGEAAKHYSSLIYGERQIAKIEEPFAYIPMEDVNGWILDLLKLLACLMDYNPWGQCFSLRWLSGRFEAGDGNDPYLFSPKNEELLRWLHATEYRRIAALVARIVQNVAEIEYQIISVAIYDFFFEKLHRIEPDWANVCECNDYIERFLATIDEIKSHIEDGQKLGLSIEEIGLIDSLWGEIPHLYPNDYVSATKEIWQKIKEVRENFVDGRKTSGDCQHFTNDMVKIVLPIAEKYEIDMELDDEHSLPLSYLKYWLNSIYYGDGPHYG